MCSTGISLPVQISKSARALPEHHPQTVDGAAAFFLGHFQQIGFARVIDHVRHDQVGRRKLSSGSSIWPSNGFMPTPVALVRMTLLSISARSLS